MTGKAEKLRERLNRTRRGFSDKDLYLILMAAGFRCREGKHTVYEHPEHTDLTTVIPRGQDLAPKYATWVKNLVETLDRRRAEAEDGR